MNRQARMAGSDQWQDFGSVSFEDAAIAMSKKANRTADKVQVFVRDADEPNQVYPLTVETVIAHKVSGLRGVDA